MELHAGRLRPGYRRCVDSYNLAASMRFFEGGSRGSRKSLSKPAILSAQRFSQTLRHEALRQTPVNPRQEPRDRTFSHDFPSSVHWVGRPRRHYVAAGFLRAQFFPLHTCANDWACATGSDLRAAARFYLVALTGCDGYPASVVAFTSAVSLVFGIIKGRSGR